LPPVCFNVEGDSEKYDERHVDGDVITEVFGAGRLWAEQARHADRKVLVLSM
jgi:hypothetical protein